MVVKSQSDPCADDAVVEEVTTVRRLCGNSREHGGYTSHRSINKSSATTAL